MRSNVFANYAAFIRVAREIAHLQAGAYNCLHFSST
jgi:hypothetical protein